MTQDSKAKQAMSVTRSWVPLDSKDWRDWLARRVKMEQRNLATLDWQVRQELRELDSWEKMDSKERKDWKATRDCQEPQDSMIKRV